jgi:hypothetical protein
MAIKAEIIPQNIPEISKMEFSINTKLNIDFFEKPIEINNAIS